MDDLDAQIEATEKSAKASKKAVSDLAAGDRSLIAKMIIIAFLIMVGIVVVAAIAGACVFEWSRLVEPGKFLMGVLGSIMLPVVTLVIGYYFGSK